MEFGQPDGAVFTARVLVAAPILVGQVPLGHRRYVPIIGGTVSGPRLRGEVLKAGGDLQITRSDGVVEVEATYFIQSDDGVVITVVNRGIRRGPAQVMARLARGEAVAPTEYYFRTCPTFEAPVESRYAWLNDALFIGLAEREPDAAVIHFHRVGDF